MVLFYTYVTLLKQRQHETINTDIFTSELLPSVAGVSGFKHQQGTT